MSEDKPTEKASSPLNSINTHESKSNSLPISGQNESSSSSVKLRKSSNIFSTLVKKARRKKTPTKGGNEEIKNLHVSSLNSSCASTLSLGVHVEEVELSCQNYEKKCSQNREYWEEKNGHSLESLAKSPAKDFDLLGTQNCSQNFKDNLVQTSQIRNANQTHVNENKEVAVDRVVEGNCEEDTAISSFVVFQKIPLDVSLADGLQYVQEMVASLHENESHIVGLLTKYIKDTGVQKQLLDAVCRHSKLQWDVERRSCSLANDMWMQQLEIGRSQEKILQGTLNSLVKQNRQLQVDNENLYRKHEKAVKILRSFENRPRCQEHDAQIDSVLRHNEKLQVKLETVFKKCESLEGELLIFQKQNDSMEQQLRNGIVKMQNMKAAIYKMKTEYELEQTALNFQLETKEQTLKEALEAADILLEDLDGLKRQQKNMQFGLNWSKFKVRGSCLTDLIHMCRSCINELSKELVIMHNEMALKDKDISTLRETNLNLQERLNKSGTELDIMSQKIEENISTTTARLLNEQKCRTMEKELGVLEGKIEELKGQIEAEKALRMQSTAEFEIYKKEVQEKDIMIDQTRLVVANVTTENYALRNDIRALSQLLNETGAGDIVREIENGQQEIEYFHKELQKLQKENHDLITELSATGKENGVLKANQEATYKNLQKQNKELERRSEEIQTLRQKCDAEHQTVLSLQNERKKYLEEKNLLRTIVQHLKIELSKIKQLEENLANVTKEASKLGLVAEYNKQQGEKLKKEVIERETVIAQLKTSVHKLNELHMQNAKEKFSLCYELNEVCQLKEKLGEVLNTEVRKNEELGQSKEAIVKSVNTQIQKIEEKQKNERTAIRILLKDIKIIAEEKEHASKENNKLQLEIAQLQIKYTEQGKKCAELTKEITKKQQENAELRRDRDQFEKKQKEISESLKNEGSMYDLNIKQLKKLIEKLRNDKKDLQNSNEYLKNNIEKLHKDLNMSRHNEKAVADTLNKTKQQREETQKILDDQSESVKNLTKEKEKLAEEKTKLVDEKEKLTKETNYLNKILDQVVNDFEKSIKTSEEKERLFKSEFDESRKLLHTYAQEIQDLNNTIDLKEKRIEELIDMAQDEQFSQKRYLKLKQEIDHLETEYAKLKQTKTDLENQLGDLQEEYEKSNDHLKNIEKETIVLENQLKIVLDQKEEDYVFYKKHIAELLKTRDEIENQNQKEIHTLRQQLQEVHNKIANEKAAYETLSQIHKEVSGKFMKSIKDLVDVKNSKQEIVDKFKENEEAVKQLENEKDELHKQVTNLADELDVSKHVVIQLNEENNILQKSYSKALDKCVSLEHQIKKIELDHQQEVNEVTMEREQYHGLQQEIDNSKKELEATGPVIHKMKMEISALQQEITLLQIERSDITVELHETKKKLETETNLSEQLKNTHKLLLAAVLQLKEDGKVDPSDCIHLLHMVRSLSSMATDDATEKV